MGPDLYHHLDGAIPKKQLTRDECAVGDPVDQCFEEASAADGPAVSAPYSRLHDMSGENRRLQEQVYGYRAVFFMLLGLNIIWGVALMANRTPPLRLNSCAALKYYLGALDESSSPLPAGTRQFLDTQAAACPPDDDLGRFDDGNPHQ
jgi:hypothetical protein